MKKQKEKVNMDFLAFLQDQMDCRRSKDENKIGTDERATIEYLILSMTWEKYLNLHGIYYTMGNEAKELYKKVEAYRNKKLKLALKKIVLEEKK